MLQCLYTLPKQAVLHTAHPLLRKHTEMQCREENGRESVNESVQNAIQSYLMQLRQNSFCERRPNRQQPAGRCSDWGPGAQSWFCVDGRGAEPLSTTMWEVGSCGTVQPFPPARS